MLLLKRSSQSQTWIRRAKHSFHLKEEGPWRSVKEIRGISLEGGSVQRIFIAKIGRTTIGPEPQTYSIVTDTTVLPRLIP